MVLSKKDKDEKVVIATCNCGCHSEIHITKTIFEHEVADIPDEYAITLHNSKFDEEQVGIFDIIKRRLKRAWYNLRGKDYVYMEILFTDKELDEFIEKLQKVRK